LTFRGFSQKHPKPAPGSAGLNLLLFDQVENFFKILSGIPLLGRKIVKAK
jgi:hypothetical protein